MTNSSQRIRFKSLNWDRPIVTVPEDFEIDGTLNGPGCGATVELPNDRSLLDKAEDALVDLVRRKTKALGQ